MFIKVLGSSSRGNCYILKGQNDSLILECGVNPKLIKMFLGKEFVSTSGCLISHEHSDHAKYATDMLENCIDIYSSAGTLKALNLTDYRVNTLAQKEWNDINAFKVYPFDTIHDCSEPNGYIIYHPELEGYLLFATDTKKIPYNFSVKFKHIFIECNYSENLLFENIRTGQVPEFIAKRTMNTHMSIDECLRYIKSLDLSQTQTVTLIHLSNDNSSPEEFKEVFQKEFNNIKIEIASENKIIDL